MKKLFSLLLMAAAVVAVSCGKGTDTPPDDTPVPADAGSITGSNLLEEGGEITLTIGQIERAETYQWYKDGAKVTDVTGRELKVTAAGTYKVAGVNAQGEGNPSPDHVVTLEKPVDPDGYTLLDYVDGYYYADYYDAGTANWSIDIYSDLGDEEYMGIYLDINMSDIYDYENGKFQTGTYTLSSSGAALTYVGSGTVIEGGMEYLTGTYGYTPDTAYMVTGGTVTITASGSGYLITTDFTATDYLTGERVDNLRYKFEGEPFMIDASDGGSDIVMGPSNDGETYYYGSDFTEISNNFYTFLMTGSLYYDAEDDEYYGVGMQLELDFYAPLTATRYITTGKYIVSDSDEPFTINPNYSAWYDFDESEGVTDSATITAGSVTVTGQTGDNYTMSIDLLLEDGRAVTGTFEGDLAFYNESSTRSAVKKSNFSELLRSPAKHKSASKSKIAPRR